MGTRRNRLMPRIGDEAPDFKATTTKGEIEFKTFRKENWVILFSHPADFTPVCTTELSEFAREHDFFRNHHTKLLGLSEDSLHSHLAWINNINEKTGVYLDFPIIADFDRSIAKLYGMLHEHESSTATVRAVFFIDPDGIIRTIMYYPLNVGRNMEEIKRTLIALQTADDKLVALPVNWHEGEPGIEPPPRTLEEMEQRNLRPEKDKVDFYLVRKAI